jgi:hypothetical protein
MGFSCSSGCDVSQVNECFVMNEGVGLLRDLIDSVEPEAIRAALPPRSAPVLTVGAWSGGLVHDVQG